MPNHITTELIASPEVIEGLTRCLTPEEIAEERKEYEQRLENVKKRGSNYIPPEPDPERRLVDFALVVPPPANMEAGGCPGGADQNGLHADGTVCWYNWNTNNWGTKWNGYDVSWEDREDGRTLLRFDTAWAHPEPVIHALAAKFPNEILEVRYADEDLGSNCGTYKIRDKECIDAFFPDGEEALELACDIKYGVPYEEKRREWDEDEAEWEFRHSVYDRFQEEAGLPERPDNLPYNESTDEERAVRAAEQKKWHEAYQEVMKKGDAYIKSLEEAELQSAIDSILAAKQ